MPKPMSIAENISKQEIITAADQCVLCGLCLPHCPTYAIAKTEPESPRGRIALVRALYEEQLDASESISSHLDHCLTCMSCERVCPANVDYEKIIDAGRAITRKQRNSLTQSLLLFILSSISVRKITKMCISIFQSLGLYGLFSSIRLFNLLPETSISIPNNNIDSSSSGPKVAIINSCAADLINDQTIKSAALILSKLGCNVIPQKQTQCCGALHQHTGNLKTAESLREDFLHSLETQKLDHVVSLATGCGAQIKRYSNFDESPSTNDLVNKLIDVNDLVLQQLNINDLTFKPLAEIVYLHKPCSQQQITNDPKAVERLLQFIPDIEIIHFEDQLACCGAGGMNTITEEKIADQLIENKIHEIKSSSANYLVSSNIGCVLHLHSQLKRKNIDTQVCHPITLLAQQML
ncbi:MAG: 4Fe-4S dicluster domain-containing protein [Gammaproteobacteria bacterium]|nr:MAG: 4Fe-4S dicluster domain-containing protein [Gammaproteobacteria bacterium]